MIIKKTRRLISVLTVLLMTVSLFAQQKIVNGNVSDEAGNSLIGVSVVKKGSTYGTTTNQTGNYSLSASSGEVLLFSYIGMQTQEVIVGSGSVYNVILREDSRVIDEVVVTALGIKREQKALGAFAEREKERGRPSGGALCFVLCDSGWRFGRCAEKRRKAP